MSFLNPIFLIGILGAGIPVIIHLFNRRRTVVHRFGAIDFVFDSQRSALLGGRRIKNLLLLILRALLIAFLSAAIARPFIRGEGVAVTSDAVPASNVFIIDDSFSMGYEIGGKTVFERAKGAARDALNSMGVMDEVAVIFNSQIYLRDNLDRSPALSIDRGVAVDAIEASSVSYTATDMLRAIDEATDVLTSARNDVRRIFIFTDMARGGWIEDVGLHSKVLRSINIIDVSGSIQPNNLCIRDVEVSGHQDSNLNGINMRLTISNHSPLQMDGLVARVYISDKMIAQGFVNLSPWSSEVKEFFCGRNDIGDGISPAYSGHAEILGRPLDLEDHISVDNVRYFVVGAKEDIKVLIVDGDPGADMYKCETFYIGKALDPGGAGGEGSGIGSQVCNIYEFEKMLLDGLDLIILCNVASLSAQRIRELEEFVNEGGALLFTLGDKVDAGYYNEYLGKLLPCVLRGVRGFGSIVMQETEGILEGEDNSGAGYVTLKRPEVYAPFRDIFSGLTEGDINSAKFQKVFLVEPMSALAESAGNLKEVTGSHVALRFSNDLPALIVKRSGRGKTAIFASSIDRDWNNLPIRPVFLPLVREICKGLTSKTFMEGCKTGIMVAEGWGMPYASYQGLFPGDGGTIGIIDPDGDAKMFDLFNPAPGNLPALRGVAGSSDVMKMVIYTVADKPGIYSISEDGKASDMLTAFAVNVDTVESDLRKIDLDKIKELLNVETVCLASDIKNDNILYSEVVKRELWTPALFLALCIIGVEAFVARLS